MKRQCHVPWHAAVVLNQVPVQFSTVGASGEGVKKCIEIGVVFKSAAFKCLYV